MNKQNGLKIVCVTFVGFIAIALGGFFLSRINASDPKPNSAATPSIGKESGHATSTRYLAFQIFIQDGSDLQHENVAPGVPLENTVADIVGAIGNTGNNERKLGFIPGPVSFDQTDEQVRTLMQHAFALALKYDIALGFHIDDSMFWGRLKQLQAPDNIEWLDWNKTLNTGRRLDWSSNPTKIMPQLCLNSRDVRKIVHARASVIGEETKKGLAMLDAAGKGYLFIGVIAGWETQIGRDYDTGKRLGYCALTNLGYSAANPPHDLDEARTGIVRDFIDYWATSLSDAGIPDAKLFSHTAFMPKDSYDAAQVDTTYLQTINFTPPSVSFGPHHAAGFSTYPQSGNLIDDITSELSRHGNSQWISAEGTALDPSQAEIGVFGDRMEAYLGSLFNHGASVVNIFGWGVGESTNPFRRTAENEKALTAYGKFLSGAPLSENTSSSSDGTTMTLQETIAKIQSMAPAWMRAHPAEESAMTERFRQLDAAIKTKNFKNARGSADEILGILKSQ